MVSNIVNSTYTFCNSASLLLRDYSKELGVSVAVIVAGSGLVRRVSQLYDDFRTGQGALGLVLNAAPRAAKAAACVSAQASQAAQAVLAAIPVSLTIPEPDGTRTEMTLPQGSTIQELKIRLASRLKTLPMCLSLYKSGDENELIDGNTLFESGFVVKAELFLLITEITQRMILEEFYRCCGGDQWKVKYGWCEGDDLSKWYGVRTIANGQITSLKLKHNNLTGQIPECLSRLTELRYLMLHQNLLSGEVPESLSTLQKLKHLSLSDNSLLVKVPESLIPVTRPTVSEVREMFHLDLL